MQSVRQGLAVAASPDGKIYAVGGTALGAPDPEAQPLSLLEEYDPVADTWTTRAPMPTPRADLALVRAPSGRPGAAVGRDGRNLCGWRDGRSSAADNPGALRS